MLQNEISVVKAIERLKVNGDLFTEIFHQGDLSVEFYKPEKADFQKPHDRDEIYIIASGTGFFYNEGKRWNFKPGDFLFVQAGAEHWFEDFSEDFATCSFSDLSMVRKTQLLWLKISRLINLYDVV